MKLSKEGKKGLDYDGNRDESFSPGQADGQDQPVCLPLFS